MQLLYLCSDFGIPPTGTKGASIHLRSITRALTELDHDVTLLSPKGGAGDDHPARPISIAGSREAEEPARTLKRWLCDRGFEDAVSRELRPLLYNAWAPSRAQALLADRPPDAIIERLSLFGYVGVELADALNVPLILEVNAQLADEARQHRSLRLAGLASEFERRVMARADAVVAVSRALADRLIDAGVPSDKVYAIPNGVDATLFEQVPSRDECRSELGLSDAFVVGFVGSLKPWHGVDVLIRAFAEFVRGVGSARLLIVGSGPAEEKLKRAATEAGIDHAILFTGAVPHERVPVMLRAMDVAVAPFAKTDNFYFSPIKLFEYMMAGTCVVASRLGQILEVIDDGFNGMLFRPDDAQDLCRVLGAAHASDPLRARLGKNAQTLIREKYTWRHTACAWVRVVEEAIQRRVMVSDSERDGHAMESSPVGGS